MPLTNSTPPPSVPALRRFFFTLFALLLALVLPRAAFAVTNPTTLSINDVTLAEGNSGATNFIFTVSLSTPAPIGGVTFDIAAAAGSAAAGSDFAANSLTGQTIPSGSSTYSFTVQVNGDTAVEFTETFFVNVTNVVGATAADAQGAGTITNDDVAPAVTGISPATGSTSGGTLVTITGTNFASGATVTIGGVPAPTSAVSATSITATTGGHAAGAVDVVVTSNGNPSTGGTGLFTYAAPGTVRYYSIALDGPSEAPPNGSPGVGTGTLIVDTVAHRMTYSVSFSGLTGNATAAHVHAATVTPRTSTAGVATTTPSFPGFPLGVTSGSFAQTYDMTLASSYNAAFVTANGGTVASAEAALIDAIDSGRAYFNIHSSTFGGGEIRGFFNTAPVPVPNVVSISPAGGTTAGGTAVTITGTGFTGATGATVGGVPLINPVVTATSITGTTGAHAAGAVDVAITGAPGGASTGGTGAFTYFTLPNLTINDVTLAEGNSGITNFAFTVSLSAPAPVGGVSFNIATANGTAAAGSDYVASSQTARTIAAGNSTYTFTVQVNGDTVIEPTETFFVNIVNVTGAVATDTQGVGTITNDDVPAPNVIQIAPSIGTTAGGEAVTISGTGFTGATGATLGGVALTNFSVQGDTYIFGTTGAHAPGAVDVAIIGAPGGANTGGVGGFIYVAPPVVTTPTSTDVSDTYALLGGNVTSDSDSAIMERGWVISLTSENADPLIGGVGVLKVQGFGTTGVFTGYINGFIPSTQYSFKAYAMNRGGVGYTSVATFTTLPPQDRVPPLVTGPTDIGVFATSAAGAVVTFVTSATDDRDGPLATTATPASGSTFPIGTTRVEVTAMDAAGNTGYHSIDVTVFAAPTGAAGEVWAPRTTSGQRDWTGVTSSADGTKLAATVAGGFIYTSTDSGATWTERTAAGNQDWAAISGSTDGMKLVAVPRYGKIYTSVDGGATWVERLDDQDRSWVSVTSSANGSKLAALGHGEVWKSVDSGATWTSASAGGFNNLSITSSADGSKLAITEGGGEKFPPYIHRSVNGGDTWAVTFNLEPSGYYFSVAGITSSADGDKLAAGLQSIQTSTDGGATWTAAGPSDSSLTSSADFTKLAAARRGDNIFTSTDFGATWVRRNSGRRLWAGIASSADGDKLVAVDRGGYIYTSTVSAPISAPTVTSPTATAITATTATLGGNVTSDGGDALIETGVVFAPTALNADPDLDDTSFATASATTGVFTVPVTGLVTGTQYSYKAYAINSVGVSYSAVATFTANAVVPVATGKVYSGLLYDIAGRVRGSFVARLSATDFGTMTLWRDGKRAGNRVLGAAQANAIINGSPVSVDFPTGPMSTTGNPTRNVSVAGTAPGETLSGVATRSPYEARMRTTLAGKYTLVSRGAGPKVGAIMYGNITSLGSVRFVTRLGNGKVATMGSQLHSTGEIPFYVGSVSGGQVQSFGGTLTVNSGNAPQITGDLRWTVPAGADSRMPAGVDADYLTIGARYAGTSAGNMLSLDPSLQVTIAFDFPSMAATSFNIGLTGTLLSVPTSAPVASLRLYQNSGFYTGLTVFGGVRRVYYGVMLQGSTLNYGDGFIIDTAGLGTATISPAAQN